MTNPTNSLLTGGVKAVLQATVNGVTADLTPQTAASDGWIWSTSGGAFGLNPGLGALPVSLHWEEQDGVMGGKTCKTSGNPSTCKGDFPNPVQQLYSGSDAGSGPIKLLSLTESGASNPGRPYSITAGSSHTVTVNVGLIGSLKLTPQTILLRLAEGSRSSAIRCDGNGASDFRDAIINGCKTPYQLNPSGICPDPVGQPLNGSPNDCVPLKPGNFGNPTSDALDTRFASCPPNNWPNYDAANDKRIVQLIVTDFSYLGGSGGEEVPVVDFGAFYVTGWGKASCANNEPWPASFAPLSESRGDIWGHFIKSVPTTAVGGDIICDPTSITPCVAVMVR